MWETHLPQAMTASLCGSALAVYGLMLQTTFKNPLADPSILGINSGTGLGVAFVILLFGDNISAGTFNLSGFFSILAGAFVGVVLIMGPILFFSALSRSNVILLITGIMIGYVTSSTIALLNFFATTEGVQPYMIWGLGNFGGVSLQQMPAFASVTVAELFGSLLLIKPLNALLLGERYTENLGINIVRARNWLLVITGLLTAITTAFCGPITFIGLTVSHIARMILRAADHDSLLPVTILSGGVMAPLYNLICISPGETGVIPLSTVTPIIGAPVTIYVIVSQRSPQHFN